MLLAKQAKISTAGFNILLRSGGDILQTSLQSAIAFEEVLAVLEQSESRSQSA